MQRGDLGFLARELCCLVATGGQLCVDTLGAGERSGEERVGVAQKGIQSLGGGAMIESQGDERGGLVFELLPADQRQIGTGSLGDLAACIGLVRDPGVVGACLKRGLHEGMGVVVLGLDSADVGGGVAVALLHHRRDLGVLFRALDDQLSTKKDGLDAVVGVGLCLRGLYRALVGLCRRYF